MHDALTAAPKMPQQRSVVPKSCPGAMSPPRGPAVTTTTSRLLTRVHKSEATRRDPLVGLFIRQSYIFISYGDEALRFYVVF